MSHAGFEGEIHRALQKGVPITGGIVAFAHILFIGADLGFPKADFAALLRYRLAATFFFAALAALSLTKWGRSPRTTKALGIIIIALCGATVSNLTAMTGGSESPYWTMIIMTYFGGTLLLRLSPLEAGAAYLFAAVYHVLNMLLYVGDTARSPEFFTTVFGLILALIVSLTGNWYIRTLQLSEYQTRQSLAEANEQLRHSITELQYKRQQEQLRYLQNKLALADDLHDSVGAKLSQIAVIADRDRIDDTRPLKALSSSVLDNVRNFAHILKGEERVATLKTQLTRLAESLSALGRYDVTLRIPDEDIRLSDITLLNLDRILSEWTANAIRHARATQLALGARMRHGRLTIYFFQNRTPFRWCGSAERGGLRSIATRAKNIDASASVRPHKGGALFVLRLKPGAQPAVT